MGELRTRERRSLSQYEIDAFQQANQSKCYRFINILIISNMLIYNQFSLNNYHSLNYEKHECSSSILSLFEPLCDLLELSNDSEDWNLHLAQYLSTDSGHWQWRVTPALVRKQQEVSGLDQSLNSHICEVTTGKGLQSVEGTWVARAN